MTLDLPTQLEALIHEKVTQGRYPSPSAVVSEALRLLDERDRAGSALLDDLRREVRAGVDQLDRGETVVLDAAELDRMRAEARARLESERMNAGA